MPLVSLVYIKLAFEGNNFINKDNLRTVERASIKSIMEIDETTEERKHIGYKADPFQPRRGWSLN